MSQPTDTQMMDYLEALDRAHIREVNRHCKIMGRPERNEKLFLVLAVDGATCWGKTHREAVAAAMKHDGVIT